MTNAEILEQLYNEHLVERIMMVKHRQAMNDPDSWINELVSEVYLILMKYPNDRLNKMFIERKALNAFIGRTIDLQLSPRGTWSTQVMRWIPRLKFIGDFTPRYLYDNTDITDV